MTLRQHIISWLSSVRMGDAHLNYWLQYQKCASEQIALGSSPTTIELPNFEKLATLHPSLASRWAHAPALLPCDHSIPTPHAEFEQPQLLQSGLMQDYLSVRTRFVARAIKCNQSHADT